MLVFLLFIFGLSIGSFLNVLIDRLPNDESPFRGRSYCDRCKKTLKWYDMIPVVSFIILGRKCRYCRAHISFYYPLVEFIAGVMFVVVFVYLKDLRFTNLEFGNYLGFRISDLEFILSYFYYAFILSSFIVIFFTDLKYGIIPDKILYPAILVSTIYHLSVTIYSSMVNHQSPIINNIFSGAGAFFFFLLLYLITRGKGMGFGDVKLSFLLGLFLGFPKILIALYLAFLTGAIVGSILIIWGKKKLKSAIPFGPFLIIGSVLSIFFGEKILQVVSHLLNF